MAGETVLIVEDRRENIVHLANNVLKPNGYQVITAMDGQRGLQRALADQPDLIVMDLNMPKMDGLEVLAALRERQVDVPVILTTFYGSEQVAQQAMHLGAIDYVVKPYEVGEMLAAVQKALARRVTPAPAREPEESIPLTRQVERWMRDMNILTRIGKALVAQLDLDRICTRSIEAAIYITRADHAFLCLAEEGDETNLHLRATRGPADRDVRLLDLPVDGGLAMQVARSAQPVHRATGQGDSFLVEIAGSFLGPIIAAPLRWQRKTWGVLLAARRTGEMPFGEGDVEWLSGLADYAAIGVRNARACQQRVRQSPATATDETAMAALHQDLERLSVELEAALKTVNDLSTRLIEGENASTS
jgi:two-component system NtrC family sensor kinase